MTKEIKTVQIYGKRWFQKSYGNTYHSVTVVVNNEETFYQGFTYGYGNHFISTACDLLNANGYSIDYYDLIKVADIRSKDVPRKKDLYKEIWFN